MTERLRTPEEVIELAAGVSWVRESSTSSAMPCVRLGRYVGFDYAEVVVWLEQCRQPGRAILLRKAYR